MDKYFRHPGFQIFDDVDPEWFHLLVVIELLVNKIIRKDNALISKPIPQCRLLKFLHGGLGRHPQRQIELHGQLHIGALNQSGEYCMVPM